MGSDGFTNRLLLALIILAMVLALGGGSAVAEPANDANNLSPPAVVTTTDIESNDLAFLEEINDNSEHLQFVGIPTWNGGLRTENDVGTTSADEISFQVCECMVLSVSIAAEAMLLEGSSKAAFIILPAQPPIPDAGGHHTRPERLDAGIPEEYELHPRFHVTGYI